MERRRSCHSNSNGNGNGSGWTTTRCATITIESMSRSELHLRRRDAAAQRMLHRRRLSVLCRRSRVIQFDRDASHDDDDDDGGSSSTWTRSGRITAYRLG